MKKVTIIIPVYNMENYVEDGVKCITEQTYENLEIIIIDDGSKDKSYFKCLAEADKDRRIAVFSKNNEGPAAARNLALRKATGDYVYFFDMDDYLERNAIETLVNDSEDEMEKRRNIILDAVIKSRASRYIALESLLGLPSPEIEEVE